MFEALQIEALKKSKVNRSRNFRFARFTQSAILQSNDTHEL
jgi:hypothetical protein